jgi:3-methyladenine DNA glycosylase AlkD
VDARKKWAREIDTALRASGSAERAAHERAYLKSSREHYGASVPAIRSVAKAFRREHPGLGHDDLLALADALWAGPAHEQRMVVVELLVLYHDRLGAGDLAAVERLLRAAGTWALVDTLAEVVTGRLVEREPSLAVELDRWAGDGDFWIRRSALLALLVPLRRGDGDFARFGRYADAMLAEKEFFVRKAIGWVLRETGKKRPDVVYEWLLPRAGRASGVTIREAVKPLREEQRTAVLAAWKKYG